MGTPVRKLYYQGAPEEGQDFCDHDDVDDNVECDDTKLWAIEEDGTLVGFVCAPHKDAYKKQIRLT